METIALTLAIILVGAPLVPTRTVEREARTRARPGVDPADAKSLTGQTRDFVSITSFGAHALEEPGHSTFDSTGAIQAAIDSLPLNVASPGILAPKAFANGGAIFVPPGRYKISRTITLRRGVRIHGASRESSQLISFTPTSVLQYLDAGRYVQDEIGIENLSIWQDPSVRATSGAAIEVKLGPASVQSVSFRGSNLLLEGTYTGVLLEAGVASSLRDSLISKTVSHGVHIRYDASDRRRVPTTSTTFEAVYVDQSREGDGFRFESAAYVSCVSCASDSNFRDGYSVEGGSTIGLYASGAERNGRSGVHLKNTNGVVLQVDVVSAHGDHDAVRLDGASNTVIIGSTFHSDGNTTGHAVRATGLRGPLFVVGASYTGGHAARKRNTSAGVLDLSDLVPAGKGIQQ